MTTFINCTPHALTVEGLGTLPASGVVPRCATIRQAAEWNVDENEAPMVRLISQTVGEVTGLPAPSWGVFYIVSGMVLTALNGSRPDVVAPDTGADAIRENGQIVAVRGFVC